MLWLLRSMALLALCALASLASAQLPFMNGFSDGNGPKVRLVGGDSLEEAAQQLGATLEQRVAGREAQVPKFKTLLQTAMQSGSQELQALNSSLGEAAPEEQQALKGQVAALEAQAGAMQALLEEGEQELELLHRAQELVRAALSSTRTELGQTIGTRRLDGLLALRRAARLASEQVALADDAARGDATLLSEEAGAMPGVKDLGKLKRWEDRAVAVAQALLARARSLELQARGRLMERRLDAQVLTLRVLPEEEKSANKAVEEAEAKLAKVTEGLGGEDSHRPPRGSHHPEARARLMHDLERRSRLENWAAEAALLRARARRDLLRLIRLDPSAQGDQQLTLPSTGSRLAELRAQRAELSDAANGIRSRLGEGEVGPELQSILKRRQEVLETSLALESAGESDLQAALDLAEIAARRSQGEAQRTSWGLKVLLSLLAGLLSLLALRFGHPRLLGWEAPAGFVSKRLHLGAQGRLRAGLAFSLLLTLIVGALCAWGVLRFVWGLPIDLNWVLAALAHPLFVVDERPVSMNSVLSLVASVLLAVVSSRYVRHFLKERVYPVLNWDTGLTMAFDTLAHYLLLLTGFLLGLHFVGIGLSSLAIFAGVLGIGIGFGMRNITENFISGVIILAERPIKIGDYIELEDGNEGRVSNIEARATTVLTRDNVSVIIPNSEFVGNRVTNWSYGDPKVRLRIEVGVAYGSDVDLIRKVLLEVAGRHGKVLKKPAPEVWFQSFGDSSLVFQMLFWIDDQVARFRIASDLRFAVNKAFQRYGIEIAFPQMDLHLRDMPLVERAAGVGAAKDPGIPPAVPDPNDPPTLLG